MTTDLNKENKYKDLRIRHKRMEVAVIIAIASICVMTIIILYFVKDVLEVKGSNAKLDPYVGFWIIRNVDPDKYPSMNPNAINKLASLMTICISPTKSSGIYFVRMNCTDDINVKTTLIGRVIDGELIIDIDKVSGQAMYLAYDAQFNTLAYYPNATDQYPSSILEKHYDKVQYKSLYMPQSIDGIDKKVWSSNPDSYTVPSDLTYLSKKLDTGNNRQYKFTYLSGQMWKLNVEEKDADLKIIHARESIVVKAADNYYYEFGAKGEPIAKYLYHKSPVNKVDAYITGEEQVHVLS